MNYLIYNKKGKILRTVQCPPTMRDKQVRKGEFIMEGTADDVAQKVVGRGKLRRVVDKTSEEIRAEEPSPEISFDERIANINNQQWRDVLNRIQVLEGS